MHVAHSAPQILSVIGVYDSNNRLVAISHLISADCLPDKNSLGGGTPMVICRKHSIDFMEFPLQKPHLSSPEERTMVVFGHNGDAVIVKAKWTGFRKMQPPDKDKKVAGVAGDPGVLEVRSSLWNAFHRILSQVSYYDLVKHTYATLTSPVSNSFAKKLLYRVNGKEYHLISSRA